ncbi:MAG: hypothetical protein DMG94_10885 [Acidobacteria bacterium]|nr:MAG: hypothetical protein DMG94_10885 [Acidobacteriota bacterium]
MSEKRVEEIVRNAVAQALERQLASVRESVVQEVLREVGPALAGKGGAAGGDSAALQKAVSAIQAGSNQKEILRALLDNTVLYSGRAALFVVKNGSAIGWQGIAFKNNDAIKDFGLDINSGLASRVMQSRALEAGASSNVDQHFTSLPSFMRTAELKAVRWMWLPSMCLCVPPVLGWRSSHRESKRKETAHRNRKCTRLLRQTIHSPPTRHLTARPRLSLHQRPLCQQQQPGAGRRQRPQARTEKPTAKPSGSRVC